MENASFKVLKNCSRLGTEHPSLEIEITLQCLQRKNPTNPMNLWRKPMSSYKENFFLGVWPFLQIRAK